MGTIYETGIDEYISTPLSKALIEPIYRDAYPALFDVFGPGHLALPDFLESTHYKNPSDPVAGSFQFAHQTTDTPFEYMNKRPETLVRLQSHMAGYRTGRASWMDHDFYPVEANLIQGAEIVDSESVFLVDIGGGKGHDLQELIRKHLYLPGKLVLQDLDTVIADAKATGLDKKIVPMAHDFFTEQPIVGARAYYMHSCLHDWPDNAAREILLCLAPAMKKGYSKLLINENVIPARGAHWLSTGLDMTMMAGFSSCERTEDNWRKLLEASGFKIIKIWTYEPGCESLIEAELA
ncbi:MAG: hypothetical protein Q9219_007457 [cf. Caloplaca sp. 3 TL-2023]